MKKEEQTKGARTPPATATRISCRYFLFLAVAAMLPEESLYIQALHHNHSGKRENFQRRRPSDFSHYSSPQDGFRLYRDLTKVDGILPPRPLNFYIPLKVGRLSQPEPPAYRSRDFRDDTAMTSASSFAQLKRPSRRVLQNYYSTLEETARSLMKTETTSVMPPLATGTPTANIVNPSPVTPIQTYSPPLPVPVMPPLATETPTANIVNPSPVTPIQTYSPPLPVPVMPPLATGTPTANIVNPSPVTVPDVPPLATGTPSANIVNPSPVTPIQPYSPPLPVLQAQAAPSATSDVQQAQAAPSVTSDVQLPQTTIIPSPVQQTQSIITNPSSVLPAQAAIPPIVNGNSNPVATILTPPVTAQVGQPPQQTTQQIATSGKTQQSGSPKSSDTSADDDEEEDEDSNAETDAHQHTKDAEEKEEDTDKSSKITPLNNILGDEEELSMDTDTGWFPEFAARGS